MLLQASFVALRHWPFLYKRSAILQLMRNFVFRPVWKVLFHLICLIESFHEYVNRFSLSINLLFICTIFSNLISNIIIFQCDDSKEVCAFQINIKMNWLFYITVKTCSAQNWKKCILWLKYMTLILNFLLRLLSIWTFFYVFMTKNSFQWNYIFILPTKTPYFLF